MLTPGDPAPWFIARSTVNPQFFIDVEAGRYMVLCFFGSAAHPASQRILADVEEHHRCFDGRNAAFLGISADPEDEKQARVKQQHPGIIYIWDFDSAIAQAYGALQPAGTYRHQTLILDLCMRLVATIPWGERPEHHVTDVLKLLDALPPIALQNGHAPILFVPYVLEPNMCRHLITLYEEYGGKESGVMREVQGKTVQVSDFSHKRRKDYRIIDRELIQELEQRLNRRLVPEIKKAFQFEATRIERYIVACYDSADGAHFSPHRDNTTKGTAHRRFAVSINLNTEEFEGGNLRFPEFGRAMYRPPTGGAVVFGCSLLHEATPVTKGKRYAFLPFLYDDAAAAIREANLKFLKPDESKAGL